MKAQEAEYTSVSVIYIHFKYGSESGVLIQKKHHISTMQTNRSFHTAPCVGYRDAGFLLQHSDCFDLFLKRGLFTVNQCRGRGSFYLKKPEDLLGGPISMRAWFLWVMWIWNKKKSPVYLKYNKIINTILSFRKAFKALKMCVVFKAGFNWSL